MTQLVTRPELVRNIAAVAVQPRAFGGDDDPEAIPNRARGGVARRVSENGIVML